MLHLELSNQIEVSYRIVNSEGVAIQGRTYELGDHATSGEDSRSALTELRGTCVIVIARKHKSEYMVLNDNDDNDEEGDVAREGCVSNQNQNVSEG